MIVNFEVILIKLLSSPNLLRAKIFGIYKLLEVVMINKDKNFIFTVF